MLARYIDLKIVDRSPFETIDKPGVGWLVRLAAWVGPGGQARPQARHLRRARRRPGVDRLLPDRRPRLRELLAATACRSRGLLRRRRRRIANRARLAADALARPAHGARGACSCSPLPPPPRRTWSGRRTGPTQARHLRAAAGGGRGPGRSQPLHGAAARRRRARRASSARAAVPSTKRVAHGPPQAARGAAPGRFEGDHPQGEAQAAPGQARATGDAVRGNASIRRLRRSIRSRPPERLQAPPEPARAQAEPAGRRAG